MQETLNDFHTSISIGGQPLCNLHFAYDINLHGKSAAELWDLTTTQEITVGTYGMEIRTEISIQTEIRNG